MKGKCFRSQIEVRRISCLHFLKIINYPVKLYPKTCSAPTKPQAYSKCVAYQVLNLSSIKHLSHLVGQFRNHITVRIYKIWKYPSWNHGKKFLVWKVQGNHGPHIDQGKISQSCLTTKSSKAQQNYAYQNNVTSQNTIPNVSVMTGILLIFAWPKNG